MMLALPPLPPPYREEPACLASADALVADLLDVARDLDDVSAASRAVATTLNKCRVDAELGEYPGSS